MTTELFRNFVLARAMTVEPIRRAICGDPLETDTSSFARSSDRWRAAARRAAQSTWASASHETAAESDDADLP